jgi:hypothetical protein
LPREAAVLRKRRRTGGLKIAPNLAGMKTKKNAARYLEATRQSSPL